MIEKFQPYIDRYFLLGRKQANGNLDGGDSCHKTCHADWLSAYGFHEDLFITLHPTNIIHESGIPVRNPDTTMWYSNPNTTSRDQLKAFITYGVLLNRLALNVIFKQHLKRLLLFAYNTRRNWQYPTAAEHAAAQLNGVIGQDVVWNYKWKMPDFCGPEIWALYVRGFRFYPLYPLLPILDIETLLGVIIKYFNKKDVDVMNDLGVLYAGKLHGSNPVMWLARKIAKTFLQERLEVYFTNEGEPPVHFLTGDRVKEL